MLFSATSVLLGSRAKGYHNRVMVYAHRRHSARYLPPKRPHARTPLANKMPEEYGNTWDLRNGVEWYYRMRKRNHFRHWPWARWSDDPIRQHEDMAHRRTLSVKSSAANEGLPEWNYYKEVGQDYDVPSHFPLTYVASFIHQYTGRLWSCEQITEYLQCIQDTTGLRSIADVADNLGVLGAWEREHASRVPRGLIQHVALVTRDVVDLNGRKAFRKKQQESGVLRTREMERYYALPHLRGPAIPVVHEQPPGQYPVSRYTNMLDIPAIHPLQIPDGRYKNNMYPA